MGVAALSLLISCLLVVSPTRSSLLPSQEPAGAEIAVERVERVSREEVHFWLKVTNSSDRPVFLAGINYESGPRPELLFIDQWKPEEGWKRTSCMDTPPPHVIKLNPGEAITQVLWAKLPMSVVCRNPISRFEGKFRFRLEYFDSQKQARTYVKKIFSPRWQEARARVAVSEPFEIPPAPTPER